MQTEGQAGTAKGGSSAAIVTLVGGVVMILGAVLAWAKVSINLSFSGQSFSQSETVKGLDTGDGKVVLVVGIIVLILGAVAIAVKGQARLFGILAAIGGVIAGGLGIWNWIDLQNKTGDIKSAAEAAAQGNAEIAKMIAAGIKVSASIGIYLVVIGGVVGLVGGILLLRAKAPASMAAPMSGGMAPPAPGMPAAPGFSDAPPAPQPPAPPEPGGSGGDAPPAGGTTPPA